MLRPHRGNRIAARHEDMDEPGSTAARSGFQRALTRAEGRDTDGIVVAKITASRPRGRRGRGKQAHRGG
jgi:hypothetical protein